ncbi:MAG: hypothetical protein NTV02_02430 [Candidatus Zambryskibacteria bacterium]|nr:hypothetical protein [Candidatus Zambryskibacteria bacterium]
MKKVPLFVQKTRSGFIGIIVLVIIALATLQFAFHIDVLAILQSPEMQKVSNFVITYSKIAWQGIVDLYKNITT